MVSWTLLPTLAPWMLASCVCIAALLTFTLTTPDPTWANWQCWTLQMGFHPSVVPREVAFGSQKYLLIIAKKNQGCLLNIVWIWKKNVLLLLVMYLQLYIYVYKIYIYTYTNTHKYILKPFLPAVSTFTLQDLQTCTFKAIMISSFWDLRHFKY